MLSFVSRLESPSSICSAQWSRIPAPSKRTTRATALQKKWFKVYKSIYVTPELWQPPMPSHMTHNNMQSAPNSPPPWLESELLRQIGLLTPKHPLHLLLCIGSLSLHWLTVGHSIGYKCDFLKSALLHDWIESATASSWHAPTQRRCSCLPRQSWSLVGQMLFISRCRRSYNLKFPKFSFTASNCLLPQYILGPFLHLLTNQRFCWPKRQDVFSDARLAGFLRFWKENYQNFWFCNKISSFPVPRDYDVHHVFGIAPLAFCFEVAVSWYLCDSFEYLLAAS